MDGIIDYWMTVDRSAKPENGKSKGDKIEYGIKEMLRKNGTRCRENNRWKNKEGKQQRESRKQTDSLL